MFAMPREVPHLAIEDLFGPPVRTRASISPDGTRIAYLAPWRDRLNVWVESVDSEAEARCVTADGNRSVLTYHWTDDPRWLLYEQDGDGDENWHIHRVDLDDPDAEAVDLTPFPGARVISFEPLVTRPGKAILSLNRRKLTEFDLYELDIATGDLTMLAENPGRITGWLCTPSGELYAQTLTAGGDIELSRWDAGTGETHPVTTFDGADYPLGVQPYLCTPDGTGVWFGSNRDGDRTRPARLDLATGEETVVDSHPLFDLDTRSTVFPTLPSPLIRDRSTGELIGVRYLGERQVIHPLDPHFAAVLENLEKLSDGDLSAISSDASGQRWVVAFTHDRDPGVTYYYDHSTGESRPLFRPMPSLEPETLAPMTPVTITARDGLALPSYLTLPVAAEPAGLPLVLLVHGGPWSRDSWGYNPVVQLLANRGYAVLQVNFRGSTGYGKAFLRAGIGELAGKMHEDLIDAVEWAVGEGYADRDRVAIFGGSYGGYAALVGVTFTPDVFAAAIDFCGPSNLVTFLRTVPEFVKPQLVNNWYLYAGNPDDTEQESKLRTRSPIGRVDEIRTPLMVVQGGNDIRVVKAESDQVVEALRARGIEVEYLVKDDEGHGFVNPENNIDVYRAADRFLARHLGGRPDTR
ncbi:alpha/beta fold hydrolase [Streptomyces sp. SID8382]|uniref:S9 family peptidase n=1 Tax=Streptomyces malaysiensis TaxID=92644 RepID=UPI000C2BADA9|nr:MULTISPECIES: S9 family peptidase [unclassified Streptomyces]AUA15395.1 Prolyl tripeptidyl peptidase precursor [Streptomyces sp. M56]MYX61908.1 alpha/beta fold hydrolase [Streptomyces sp. SID8382]